MVLADKLRKSVLQYALQGQLSKQLSTDSDVNEFINEIKLAKQKLVKEKKIAKEKKVDEVCKEELWSIPDSWAFEKIGNLFYVERGSSPRPISSYLTSSEDGVNWIKIGDTEIGGKYINSTKEKITKEGALKSRAVYKGDFIFTNSMSFGRPYILNIDGYIHDGWNVIHNIEGAREFNKDYLYYVLSSNLLKEQILSKVDGGVMKNIRSDELRDLVIPIPPLEEQQRIVDKLNILMKEIDEYELLENKLEKIKKEFPEDFAKSVMQYAMQGKLTKQLSTDSDINDYINDLIKNKKQLIKEKKYSNKKKSEPIEDDDILFDIPDSWRWIRFGDLVDFKLGKTPERQEIKYWKDKKYKWVSIADMNANGYVYDTKEYVSEEAKSERFGDISPAETLIMSFKLTVGRVSILGCDAFHNEAIISIFPLKDDDNIVRDYLFKILPYITKYGDKKNAIKGATLNSTSIANLMIPLPPIEEQKRIVDKLNQLLPLVSEIKELK